MAENLGDVKNSGYEHIYKILLENENSTEGLGLIKSLCFRLFSGICFSINLYANRSKERSNDLC